MPLVPNIIERTLFLTLNQGPGVTLDLWAGPTFRIVLAAIRLNVFETLNTADATAVELATRLATDPRGTRILLDTLVTLGYVQQQNGRYGNTAMTRKWLTNDGDINFSSYYRFWGAVLEELWPRLEESFQTGQPPINLYEWIEDQPEVSRHFQEGMIAIAKYIGGDVVSALKLPSGATRLLDIGGGHAMYSIALCRAHPALSAVVFDSPQALTTGHDNITAENMNGQITMQEGSFLIDDLGQNYDMALLMNIIHGLSPEQNIALFQKTANALNRGGMIVIGEQLPDSAPLPLTKTVAHILSASYFHLLGGQIYTYDEISDWLRTVGFSQVARKNLLRAGSTLITAVK